MSSSSQVIVASGRLRGVFVRRDDRWGHRLEWCIEGGRSTPLLESVEGSPGELASPSPPVQEIQMHQSPDGLAAALGVGMAGRNHWSLTVTPACRAHRNPLDDWLAFGLACRVRERVPELQSAYRIIPPMQLTQWDARTVEIVGTGLRLRVHSAERLVATEGGLVIVVATEPSRPTPYTQNWSYEIGCEPNANR